MNWAIDRIASIVSGSHAMLIPGSSARGLAAGLLALIALAAPAAAMEQWGRVRSVDCRFGSFDLLQDGNYKVYRIRVGPDTVFVTIDGRVLTHMDLRELDGKRVFAIVEENSNHFADKVWVRADLAPEADPVNPGVGSVVPAR